MQQTIKEASAHTGLSAHTIRYYERVGLIPFLARDKNNNRIFDHDALHWLELLTCLRVTGMPLSKQKEIVELTKCGNNTVSERIEVLKEHQAEMYRRQAELDRAFKKIEKKLACYQQLEQEINEKEGKLG
ncbi:MerR family transcriptional regulator [Listeria ivanovii]|uniref:MerR family transcriptional regulator n=1 Tax=Listeria ivanovii TaxID=1638 RepID=UPI000DA7AFE6|nr:MerR family transcriptional regulator [Listeria ivanovii]PZF91277.1 MerR family transcriptional regulator [Listeria ivanovii]PZF96785.1 MerR family transcriptional regulator [Listeria ivanovii]PZG06968.1 MerR family transcriptional regulator [Listeria ivanovii]PZG11791.1 MerR family transcriptional regulator [Listeria ivanovii]PZG28916.1 MerR family transcriptional regulator [Listeria ivanovii]